MPIFAAVGFIIVVVVAVFAGRLPFGVLIVYLVASVIAFAAYAMNKAAFSALSCSAACAYSVRAP